jgi:hypothetical protein
LRLLLTGVTPLVSGAALDRQAWIARIARVPLGALAKREQRATRVPDDALVATAIAETGPGA